MSPVNFSPVLILVGKVELLLDMMRVKKGLLDLSSGHKLLFFQRVSNVLSTDSDVGDVLELRLQLGSSIGFACGDKSHQLMAIMERELWRTTTSILFERASELRTYFRNIRVTNTKSSCNLATGVTIFQHRNDRVTGISWESFHRASTDQGDVNKVGKDCPNLALI
jgi:hypothetical protein